MATITVRVDDKASAALAALGKDYDLIVDETVRARNRNRPSRAF
jgi:hypothetical protein